jgi:hypothetical protein
LKQTSFAWNFHQDALPQSLDSDSTVIATIDAFSNRPLKFDLRFTKAPTSTGKSHADLGLSFEGNKLVASHAFLQNINEFNFPLQGLVGIADDRTECFRTSVSYHGPCQTSLIFTLSMAEFQPACPQDIFLFSPADMTPVSWLEPSLHWRNGNFTSLPTTAPSGSLFPIGTSTVEYALPKDPSQNPNTTIQCSFKVTSFA